MYTLLLRHSEWYMILMYMCMRRKTQNNCLRQINIKDVTKNLIMQPVQTDLERSVAMAIVINLAWLTS